MADVPISFGGEMRELQDSLKGMESYIKGWGSTIKGLGVAAFAGWVSVEAIRGIKGLISVTREWVDIATEAHQVDLRLDLIVKNTGEAAGFTSEQLKNLASGLQTVTIYGDETIKTAEGLLLRFKSIKGDEFKRTLSAAADMASFFEQDLSTSVEQLGRALEDPARGMLLLRRNGINLTQQQKDLISALVQTGNKAEAQAVILSEVESVYKGTAKAVAEGAGGGWKQFDEIIGDLKEALGNSFLPLIESLIPVFKDLALTAKENAEEISGWVDEVFDSQQVQDPLDNILNTFRDMVIQIKEIGRSWRSLKLLLAEADRGVQNSLPGLIHDSELEARLKEFRNANIPIEKGLSYLNEAEQKAIRRYIEFKELAKQVAKDDSDRLDEQQDGPIRSSTTRQQREARRAATAEEKLNVQPTGTKSADLVGAGKQFFEKTFGGLVKTISDGSLAEQLGNLGKGITDVVGDLGKATKQTAIGLVDGKGGGGGEASAARFEGLQQTFKRIQESAASEQKPEVKAAKETAIATKKSAASSEAMAAGIDTLVSLAKSGGKVLAVLGK